MTTENNNYVANYIDESYASVYKFNKIASNLNNVTPELISNQLSYIFEELTETIDALEEGNDVEGKDDIVKVEVWDVVDRSKKKRSLLQTTTLNSKSLKLENKINISNSDSNNNAKTIPPVEASLDAEFIDFYKNTNGCIMIYDITKQWTWDYVERELPKIPAHIPVLIIGNHRDMQHHRNVDDLKCRFFIENLNR